MGLSIHYYFEYHQDHPDDIINNLRHKALTLPFETVSDIEHFKGDECNYMKRKGKDEWSWLLIQVVENIKDTQNPRYSYGATPIEIIAFRTWPGKEWEDWKKGLFDGKKLEEEVEKRVKSKIDFDREEERLNDLKDDLLEELWLAGQPDEVKDILSKMK
ncbi:unnamed protein product [marine sediment metagenome]|uniref:Uncharacterized protein n=1 Tax=marine sediment metagenome TaxID=412755 RepID=X1Q3E0_9ZZZZ